MLYVPNAEDRIYEETSIPTPMGGAPCPQVMASEHVLLLAYYRDVDWHSSTAATPLGLDNSIETVSLVEFRGLAAYFSVPVGDEIREAHPLVGRGPAVLDGVVRVENSPLIRRLLSAQYVHHSPYPQAYDNSKHWIFVFKDSMFEIVAKSFTVREFRGLPGQAWEQVRAIFTKARL